MKAERVQIEVTETAIFDDHERAAKTLKQLRDAGFRVALDDFGTGYSSLFNIRNFPLDCLKIDRSFVENMGREPQSAAIIHSVTHLARSLGWKWWLKAWKPKSRCRPCAWPGAASCKAISWGRR
jgi:EAL domain-containing protein (putative c-di-GMP-specific phosphodiesterase class I)